MRSACPGMSSFQAARLALRGRRGGGIEAARNKRRDQAAPKNRQLQPTPTCEPPTKQWDLRWDGGAPQLLPSFDGGGRSRALAKGWGALVAGSLREAWPSRRWSAFGRCSARLVAVYKGKKEGFCRFG